MKAFTSIMKRLRQFGLTATAVLALATIGVVAGSAGTAHAADWSNNAIVKGGASSCKQLISKVKADKELQKIYSQPEFGLYPQYYDDFANNCKSGVATRDNKVIVNGKTYEKNVGSIGRIKSYQGSGAKTFNIPGAGQDKYYGNVNSKSFAAGTSSIPVNVLIVDGNLQFAVMTGSCGNPVYFEHAKPTYSCNELNVKSAGTNRYELTTSASAGNGADIDHVVYNVGGQTYSRQSPKTVVTVGVTKDTRVTVTVYVKLPNGSIVTVGNGGDCAKNLAFTPPAPVFSCTNLILTPGKVEANGDTAYTLTGTAAARNATITNYRFTLGDNTAATDVKTGATIAKTTHTYKPGTYTAKLLVSFAANGKTYTAGNTGSCVKTLTIKNLPTSLVCNSLTATKGAVEASTGNTAYSFTAKATATNATIKNYAFDLGDKNDTDTVVTNATTATSKSHTYAPGTYTTKVAVNGTDIYGKTLTANSPYCVVSITVGPKVTNPGVTITKLVDGVKDKQVVVGTNFNYQLRVTNTGDVDLTNTVVTDTPPAGVVLATTQALGTVTNNNWTYTIPSLKVGASADFTLIAQVPNYVDGSLVNTACVYAPEVNPSQPTQPDKCDTATVHVPPATPKNPNITITKTVDGVKSKQVNVNQNFVYQLIVKNTGEKDLTNAVVTDPAPENVTMISADLGTITDNKWSYTIPTLAVGQSVTVNITAKVDAYVDGSIVNTACVNAPEVNPEQPNENDACDTATVTVPPVPVTPPVVTPPAVLPNTGAGSIISLFGASAIVSTIGYRIFLKRRLSN